MADSSTEFPRPSQHPKPTPSCTQCPRDISSASPAWPLQLAEHPGRLRWPEPHLSCHRSSWGHPGRWCPPGSQHPRCRCRRVRSHSLAGPSALPAHTFPFLLAPEASKPGLKAGRPAGCCPLPSAQPAGKAREEQGAGAFMEHQPPSWTFSAPLPLTPTRLAPRVLPGSSRRNISSPAAPHPPPRAPPADQSVGSPAHAGPPYVPLSPHPFPAGAAHALPGCSALVAPAHG